MIIQSKFVVLSALVTGAVSAISPVSDLHIVNQNIAPDGFNREYVDDFTRQSYSSWSSTALSSLEVHFLVHSLQPIR